MIISHSHEFIFLKSMKTAGTSIEAALSRHCDGSDIVTDLGDYRHNRGQNGEWIHQSMNAGDFKQHDDSLKVKSQLPCAIWESYFKFSITRNPWDRIVSLFTWKKRNDRATGNSSSADRFDHVRREFSQFVQDHWENNDRFYLIDNELCVDYIIRYESLISDFKEVCKRTGLEELELPRLKTGFRKDRHYSEYYDEETKKIVYDRHANDIRLFGYVFEDKHTLLSSA